MTQGSQGSQGPLGLNLPELMYAVKNRETVLAELRRLDIEERAPACETSLHEYLKFVWPIIEPRTPFVDGWVVGCMTEHLQAVERGQIRRILFNVPPGTSKSVICSAVFPTWIWGPRDKAHLKFFCASYAESLVFRDNRRSQRIIDDTRFQIPWHERCKLIKRNEGLLENDKLGFKFATTVKGAGTGERGDFLIIDDPHSVKLAESDQERNATRLWFTETLTSRVTNPVTSAVIVVMQRLHEQDVSGLIISEMGGYEHVCIPMRYRDDHPTATGRRSTSIGWVDPRSKLPDGQRDDALAWEERFPRVEVDRMEREMSAVGGPYAVAGQHDQNPVPRKGGIFDVSKILVVNPQDVPAGAARLTARAWDLAATAKDRSPWTVGVRGKLVHGLIWIEDVWRERFEPGELELAMQAVVRRDGLHIFQDFPQDPAQAGKWQKRAMSATMLQGHTFSFSAEVGDKDTRANPFASQVNVGNVRVVRGPWTDKFLAELRMYPAGAYKDQVDACSRLYQRLLLLQARFSRGGVAAPETHGRQS